MNADRLYFAYGSNLHWPQMSARCPDAQYLCRATLADHALAFTRDSPARGCGVADAVYRRFSMLHGVLYAVSDRDIETLDRLEGHMPGVDAYRRVVKRVWRLDELGGRGDLVRAQTYVVTNKVPHVPPSATYLQLLIDGARAWGLPAETQAYLAQIRTVEEFSDAGGR